MHNFLRFLLSTYIIHVHTRSCRMDSVKKNIQLALKRFRIPPVVLFLITLAPIAGIVPSPLPLSPPGVPSPDVVVPRYPHQQQCTNQGARTKLTCGAPQAPARLFVIDLSNSFGFNGQILNALNTSGQLTFFLPALVVSPTSSSPPPHPMSPPIATFAPHISNCCRYRDSAVERWALG